MHEAGSEGDGPLAAVADVMKPFSISGVRIRNTLDPDGDTYVSALDIEWNADTLAPEEVQVYAKLYANDWLHSERYLGQSDTYTIAGNQIDWHGFTVPVDAKDLDHTTWDFKIELYSAKTNKVVYTWGYNRDPLNDVKVELSSQDLVIRWIDALGNPVFLADAGDDVYLEFTTSVSNGEIDLTLYEENDYLPDVKITTITVSFTNGTGVAIWNTAYDTNYDTNIDVKPINHYYLKDPSSGLESARLQVFDLSAYSHLGSSSIEDLIIDYSPIIIMDDEDCFEPNYVEAFTWGATLRDSYGKAQNWDSTQEHALEALGQFTHSSYYLDLPGSTHSEADYNFNESISSLENYENAIYATVVERFNQDLAIEYWIPYYMSDWHDYGGFNTHEGDWEGIVVYFDKDGPDKAAFSKHRSSLVQGVPFNVIDPSDFRLWDDLEKVGSHPVVYSGLGGHASYFVDSDMYGGTYYLGVGTEFHDGNGKVFSSVNNLVLVDAGSDQTVDEGQTVSLDPATFTDEDYSLLEVYSLPNSTDGWLSEFEWLKFGGHWGQKSWYDGGLDLGNDGPRGPAFSDYWDDPFIWVDTLSVNTLSADVFTIDYPTYDLGDTHTATINWGDGTAVEEGVEEGVVVDENANTVSGSHVYADNGTYTVTVTVYDDKSASGSDTLTVTVNNVAPTVDAGPDQTVDEGDVVNFSGSFTDPGSADTHTIEWDFGDGSTVGGTLTPNHVYADDGTYTVTLTVTDDEGDPDSDTLIVTVNNVAPIVNAGPDQTVDEGDVVNFSGSFTDPGSADTHTIEWDFGDASTASGTLTPSHIYADNDTYTVTLTVTDDDTGSGSDSIIVTVNNVSPVLSGLSAANVSENGTSTLTGTITDPGTLDTFTVDVDWGDGTAPETFHYPAGTTSFSETHHYLDDNPSGTPSDTYTITVTVTDDDTDSDTASTVVTVNNVAPVITSISSSSPGVGDAAAGEEVTFAAQFTDVGTLDSHTAVIDWGDGTNTSGQIIEADGSGTVSDSHVYTDGGIYTITISLMDDDEGLVIGTTTAVITGAGVHDGVLQIIGTSQNDHVTVNLSGSRHRNKQFKVHANFLPSHGRGRGYKTFDAANIRKIVVLVGDGNDKVTIAGNIKVTAVVDGGAGNDKLRGGRGADILLGAEGKDNLRGGGGRDLLIGGDGCDRIVGNSGDDLLIGGPTLFDIDDSNLGQDHVMLGQGFDEALMAILAEWNSERDFETRVNNLKDGSGSDDRLNGSYFLQKGVTVFDDGVRDRMTGSSGKDWFISFDPDKLSTKYRM